MAQLISNEIPSGLVNGVNKIYTLSMTATQILSLYVDGAEYYDFTFTGLILTLTDAPTLSIRVDYTADNINVSYNGSVTLGDMLIKTYLEMEQNSDSTTYNIPRLINMINEVGQEIREGKVANELTGKFIQGNIMNFATSKFAVNPIGDIAIVGDITSTSIEILMDTTNIPTTGAIMLGNEVIKYTSKGATKITGVTGILSNHKAGEKAIVLYSLPTNLWKPQKVYAYIASKELEIPLRDDINNQYRYYEIIDSYVFFYGIKYNDTIYVKYTTKYIPLATNIELSLFPTNIALNIIPTICGGRLIKDEVLRVKLLNQGYNKLANEYAKQGETAGKPNGIQWKRFGFSSIR